MFNGLVLVLVSAFSKKGQEADKNGSQNVFLQPIAGKIPNKAMVIAGTVAEKAGLAIGQTCLVMVNERKADPVYGRQFSVSCLGEVKGREILDTRKELGEPLVLDATDGQTNTNQPAEGIVAHEGAVPSLQGAGLPLEAETANEKKD